MQTKLIRKQLLLDSDDLNSLDKLIQKEANFVSLSHFVRELIKSKIKSYEKLGQSKKTKLLSKKGFLKTSGTGKEALNHNDIYKI